jgi:outer membrane beta-barrel protein
MDFPTDTTLVVASWYPLYGKLNFFNLGVTHFDIYALAGYGKTAWVSSWGGGSGLSDTYAAGGGVGLWLSRYFTIRLEARYQTYQDQFYNGARQENLLVGMGSLGILL